MRRTRFSRPIALGVVMIALLVGAQPVFAEQVVTDQGRTGDVFVDEPGGRCTYQSGTGKLLAIRAFKPQAVHSDYPPGNNTWVGWRMKVLRSTNNGASWESIYQSAWQKDKATNLTPADGFSKIDWNAPVNPFGRYKVHLVFKFYVPGSKTNDEGRMVLQPDTYEFKIGNNMYAPVNDYCAGAPPGPAVSRSADAEDFPPASH